MTNLEHFFVFYFKIGTSWNTIDYKNNKINNYEYILNDIKKSNSRTMHSKKWIILTIDNFKEFGMIKSENVRNYYLNLEKNV